MSEAHFLGTWSNIFRV